LTLEFRRELGLGKRGHNLVTNFCGWDKLRDFEERCRRPDIRGLGAVLFSGGFRITEATLISSDQWREERINGKDYYIVNGAPVLKKPQSAEQIRRLRNIPIPADEPLAKIAYDYAKSCSGRLFDMTRQYAWRLIKDTDSAWWPHRFRTERASQLVQEYGFDTARLMKWFNWDKAEEAVGYVRLSVQDLAMEMRSKRSEAG